MAVGAVATNPASGTSIPVFVADYVLMGYGTGAIMGVPGQDERDWEFAEAFDVPIIRTVQPPDSFEGRAYTGDGPAINSSFLDGLDIAAARQTITGWRVWPSAWQCQAVRAPGLNRTVFTRSLDGTSRSVISM